MCAALGIQIMPASSPQAKGRIERNHGAQQDRVVKKLRLRGIGDLAAANTFLETRYWADHNHRFAQAATSPHDFHVARPRGLRLDTVLRLEKRGRCRITRSCGMTTGTCNSSRRVTCGPRGARCSCARTSTGTLRFGIAAG